MEISGIMFNWVDILIASVIGLAFLLGIISGFVMQLAGILSIVAGLALAFVGGPFVREALGRWIDSDMVCGFLSYALCFTVGSLVVRIIAAFFSVAIKKLKLEKFDRLAGGMLGAFKGAAICAVALVLLAKFQVGKLSDEARESVIGGKIIVLADFVNSWMDENNVGGRVEDAAKQAAEKARNLRDEAPERLRNADVGLPEDAEETAGKLSELAESKEAEGMSHAARAAAERAKEAAQDLREEGIDPDE